MTGMPLMVVPILCTLAWCTPYPMDFEYKVATIVAGEVGTAVPTARMPVACTVVRDYQRGLDLDKRWYGRGTPSEEDLRAASRAIAGECSGLPYFRFLGSEADLTLWRWRGWVTDDDALWYWHCGTHAAVGVVE